jgi:glycerol-3-phosphate dehydrogenase
MALTLGDLLIRRLHPAFELRDNARSIAPAAATIVAPSLDWDAARVAEELEEYAEEVQRIFGWRER